MKRRLLPIAGAAIVIVAAFATAAAAPASAQGENTGTCPQQSSASAQNGNIWTCPQPLSMDERNAEQPQVAIADDGSAIVVWLTTTGVQRSPRGCPRSASAARTSTSASAGRASTAPKPGFCRIRRGTPRPRGRPRQGEDEQAWRRDRGVGGRSRPARRRASGRPTSLPASRSAPSRSSSAKSARSSRSPRSGSTARAPRPSSSAGSCPLRGTIGRPAPATCSSRCSGARTPARPGDCNRAWSRLPYGPASFRPCAPIRSIHWR